MTDRSILGDIGTRSTPQGERTPGRTDEVQNSAGGFVHALDDWGRLDRFLILGVDQGTFYVGKRELALDNAEMVDRCLDTDYTRTIDTAVNVSVAGRAPSNDPALFVIACGASHADEKVRRYALSKLREVARIGTHLFHFVRFAQSRRGWGRTLARAVADWYEAREPDSLAYDVVKYRQRDGWSHRDVLRKAHPKVSDVSHNAVLRFAANQPIDEVDNEAMPALLHGFAKMQEASDAPEAAALVREYKLPWETVPSDFLKGSDVWRALLEAKALPLGATLRNLGVLTNRGVIKTGKDATTTDIVERLISDDEIRKARIHPIGILNALVTYRNGTSRGGVTWAPVPSVVNALDEAFYKAFGNVDPTGKRIMLALDVSGSMGGYACNGSAFNAREGSCAMAMVTAAVEKDPIIVGFSHGLIKLDVSPRRRLDDNINAISGLPFDRTDCAQPMLYAIRETLEVDAFLCYTDNETWSGSIKPVQALRQYRDKTGIDAKLIVVGMTSTGFTIADPTDSGMLDVVGFDTAVPQVMSSFVVS